MDSTGTPIFASSRYNFAVSAGEEFLIYNSSSGAVIRLSGEDAVDFVSQVSSKPRLISTETLDANLLRQLIDGGFLVQVGADEVEPIRERFHAARMQNPVVLTLTTTMDCNLGCYYCYEERSNHRLAVSDVPQVVTLARRLLTAKRKDSLHVDWYGGEPLMNLVFLEEASIALQELSAGLNVAYSASVISNGTCWPQDVGEFVRRHRIRQVQVSFDGMRKNHDRRRRYRNGHEPSEDASSFNAAVKLVDDLVNCARVDLRFNIDRANRDDVLPFVWYAKARDWFGSKFKVVFQPARLASYTEHSSFMRRVELSLEEYEQIRAMVREEIGEQVSVEESEVPDKFPYPRTSVCAALATDSVVVGADSKLYRCGLQVGESQRTVGNLVESDAVLFPILNQSNRAAESDEQWWTNFDPTLLPTCSRCSFLPVCWGGCPKKHLEGDRHALLEQGAYWRRNLPRLIAEGVGMTCDPAFTFAEVDQFRVP